MNLKPGDYVLYVGNINHYDDCCPLIPGTVYRTMHPVLIPDADVVHIKNWYIYNHDLVEKIDITTDLERALYVIVE